MKIAVLGTGMVGKTIASKLNSLGHDVVIGTRNRSNTLERKDEKTQETFSAWMDKSKGLTLSSYDEIDSDTDLFVNATSGMVSREALSAVGEDILDGKVILDLANALDFSKGFPPSLPKASSETSLTEELQEAFPKSMIVKSLNTMNCEVMMNPALVPGRHNIFVSGDHEVAKTFVKDLLNQIGWDEEDIIDLGGLATARGTELMMPIWLSLMNKLGTMHFNFSIVK